ncbi:uncharacterized protein [Macrobrachium rosenbergii]|uniref:uncharacterized protein isoform X2 n=1 Tax=Macrobrachium rosenbergii TaxID=79674 RepID=UPI0034D6B03C
MYGKEFDTKHPANQMLLSEDMKLLSAVVRWSLGLTALFPLAYAAKEKVCADLVGTGGVGVRIWPTLKASPIRIQHHLTFRLVQINWEAEEIFEGDWVGVFPKDPRPPMRRSNPLGLPVPQEESLPPWEMPAPLFWDTPYSTQGQLTSNVTQGRVELQMLAAGGCVGVWTGFIRNGIAVAADCLASHPNWLWQNRDVLGSRSLRSLVIPGSHNSGSYSLKDEDDVVSAWVVCQDESIISQLLYGIRYLDLRVAYYPQSPEKLWVNHDLVQWRPLEEVLSEIQTFLTLSKDPIIIDIHRTPVGFEFSEAVPSLLSLLNNTFGRDFLPDRLGPQVTLDQIWSIGKRVIFAYIDADVAEEEDWIWPPLPQAWANAQMLGDLQHYLDGQMTLRQSSPRIWAAMAHLTPSFWDVILRSHEGVRGLSDRVNRPVTMWLRERWAHLANIVATDFFRGNNIINIAIRTNLALSVCPSGSTHRPRYSYKSSGFLRRSTVLPDQFSPMIIPKINFNEAMRNIPVPESTTVSPLLGTLSTPHPPKARAMHPYSSTSRNTFQGRNFEGIHAVHEPREDYKKSEPKSAAHVISPIHSLLDIFGFNTTNTSTITSRLLPSNQNDYEAEAVESGAYEYDPDLFSDNLPKKQGSFMSSQISGKLPLILETSMSIALQGDYEDEDSQNSGDIPFKILGQDVFENKDKRQSPLQVSASDKQNSQNNSSQSYRHSREGSEGALVLRNASTLQTQPFTTATSSPVQHHLPEGIHNSS